MWAKTLNVHEHTGNASNKQQTKIRSNEPLAEYETQTTVKSVLFINSDILYAKPLKYREHECALSKSESKSGKNLKMVVHELSIGLSLVTKLIMVRMINNIYIQS